MAYHDERRRGRFPQRRDRRYRGDYDDDIRETRNRGPYGGFDLENDGRDFDPPPGHARARRGSYIPDWRDHRQGNASDYTESYDSRRYGYGSHSYGGERDRYPTEHYDRPFEDDRYPESLWSPERGRRFGSYGGGHRGRGPRGYTRSDERINEDINDQLTEDGWIDASDIEVGVSSGEVMLNGTVDSRETKRIAEDIAEDVLGVTHVQNNLRVDQGRQ